MGRNFYLLFILTAMLAFTGCKKERKLDRETYREILTSRTLGLAYLEENKLDEAEAEFLKLTRLAPDEAMGFANLGLVYLRKGEYEKSVAQLKEAIDIEPENPDIRLILAKVYEVTGDLDKSLETLKEILDISPDHVKTLYSLAEFYGKKTDPESLKLRQEYLQKVVDQNPENIVPRLYLIELLIRNGDTEKALEFLAEIEQQYPVFPDEAASFYKKAMDALKQGKNEEALTAVRIFHNFLKVSSPYQAGILELKGPGGELIGFPVISMGEPMVSYVQEGESILESIRFTDVSVNVGLQKEGDAGNSDSDTEIPAGTFALGDYDGDGDQDVYYKNNLLQKDHIHLFRNEMGTYTDVFSESGISHQGVEEDAIFADYDNDGFLDLFILKGGGNVLYRNMGDGQFEDVTRDAGVSGMENENIVKWIDLDHDGDLDIMIGRNGINLVYRNNADGSFTETAHEMGLAGTEVDTRDIEFGDFDDDGDIDLYVANYGAPDNLYTNLREGHFRDILKESGIQDTANTLDAAVGDYNNDGYSDLFLLKEPANSSAIYSNRRDGSFEKDKASDQIGEMLNSLSGREVDFFDFDNDGALDILVSGSSDGPGRSFVLIHNDGWAAFDEVNRLLPEEAPMITRQEVADFNEDGDLDIYVLTGNGKLKLYRNDGGNANHYIKIQLVGLLTGSSKNNHFGIGSKVEVRSGDLYQMKVVTNPNVHFGLGGRSQADVVRIVWTNGVPQNLFTPRSDQDLIEEQELKGSCPFLYAWDGGEYKFVKDFMWKSALGMPLGIMGGEQQYAFPDASEDYIKIPGELLNPQGDKLVLQVTSELWETIYFDKARLIAVDHPGESEILVDEKFTPPPFEGLNIYKIRETFPPVRACDAMGHDFLPIIAEHDDQYITLFNRERYQGITEMKELILDLGDQVETNNLHLFLRGWIFPTDASINYAMSQSDNLVVIPPYLQVLNERNEWETILPNIGFPMGKDKTVVVGLDGKFMSDQRKVRILTNMEIYWDHIYYAYPDSGISTRTTWLKPEKVDLHYRGFSKMYRKGGIYGPHWFDYQNVTKETKWRDLTGMYTRYGEVTELLAESDNQYIIANSGDEMTITFNYRDLPRLPKGWKRDYLINSVGWVKDGDLNTASGQTVEPLPFHGMDEYPYKTEALDSLGEEVKVNMNQYNTRSVTAHPFRHQLSGIE